MLSITAVSITPNPIPAGQTILLAVSVDFTMHFDSIEGKSWSTIESLKWTDIDYSPTANA